MRFSRLTDLTPISNFYNLVYKNPKLSISTKYAVLKNCLFIRHLALRLTLTELVDASGQIVPSNQEVIAQEEMSLRYGFNFEITSEGYLNKEQFKQSLEEDVIQIIEALQHAINNDQVESIAGILSENINFNSPLDLLWSLSLNLKLAEADFYSSHQDTHEFDEISNVILNMWFENNQVTFTFKYKKDAEKLIKLLKNKYTPKYPYNIYPLGPHHNLMIPYETFNLAFPYLETLWATKSIFQTETAMKVREAFIHAIQSHAMSIENATLIAAQFSTKVLEDLIVNYNDGAFLFYAARYLPSHDFLKLVNKYEKYIYGLEFQNKNFLETVALYQGEAVFVEVFTRNMPLFLNEKEARTAYLTKILTNFSLRGNTASFAYYDRIFRDFAADKNQNAVQQLNQLSAQEWMHMLHYVQDERSFWFDFLVSATEEQALIPFKKVSHDFFVNNTHIHFLSFYTAVFLPNVFKHLVSESPVLRQAFCDNPFSKGQFNNVDQLRNEVMLNYVCSNMDKMLYQFPKAVDEPLFLKGQLFFGRGIVVRKPNITNLATLPFRNKGYNSFLNVFSNFTPQMVESIFTTKHGQQFFLDAGFSEKVISGLQKYLLKFSGTTFQEIDRIFYPGFLLEFIIKKIPKNKNDEFLLDYYIENSSLDTIKQVVTARLRDLVDLLLKNVGTQNVSRLLRMASAEAIANQIRTASGLTILHHTALTDGDLFLNLVGKISSAPEYEPLFAKSMLQKTDTFFNPLGNILGILLKKQSPKIVNLFLKHLENRVDLFRSLILTNPIFFAISYRPCLLDDSISEVPDAILNVILNRRVLRFAEIFRKFYVDAKSHGKQFSPRIAMRLQINDGLLPQPILFINHQPNVINKIKAMAQENRVLMKAIQKQHWPDFVEIISNRQHRPAQRRERTEKQNMRFNLLKGLIEKYTKQPPDTPRHSTKKTSMTLIAKTLQTAVFGENRTKNGLVGVFVNWSLCVTKATFIQDTFTYKREWVAEHRKDLLAYQQRVKQLLYLESQREDFISKVNENPFAHSELMVTLPYDDIEHAILAVVIIEDTPEARALAREQQDNLYHRFLKHWEIIFYDRFQGDLSLYTLSMQEQDCPERRHLLRQRVSNEDYETAFPKQYYPGDYYLSNSNGENQMLYSTNNSFFANNGDALELFEQDNPFKKRKL